MMSEFWTKLRYLFSRQKPDELDDELHFHLQNSIEARVSAGMSVDEARRQTLIEFGGVERAREQCYEQRPGWWLASVLQDVRYGFRMMARSPAFTVVAVASLALGIGANTAIFTLAKSALIDALAVAHPNELRLLALVQGNPSEIPHDSWGNFYTDPQGRTIVASFSYRAYEQMRSWDHSLGDLFAFVDIDQFGHLSATINGHAEIVTGELVSGNYFDGLGVTTVIGRPIEPADDSAPGAGAVAVISDSFWERRFNRSPAVIGKTVDVNSTPITIVGVAPKGFTGATSVQTPKDMFLPLSMQPLVLSRQNGSLLSNPDIWWIQVMGRLQPGVPEEQARASLAVTLDQAVRGTMTVPKDRTIPPLLLLPGNRGWSYPARELERPMPLLLALAGLVLLLACANVANLLLARSSSRQREISVRLALGAGKKRIVRQMLTESLMLSSLGGAMGLLLGYLGRNLIPHLLSTTWEAMAVSTRFDWRVFLFTLTVALLTGLGFGIGPAWQATRFTVNNGLKDSGIAVTHRRKGIAGKALVIFQVSLCMLLLVGAGLFVRTLANLNAVDPGFTKQGLLLFGIDPPKQRYPEPKNIEAIRLLEQRVGSLPGVESATLSNETLLGQSISNSDFIPEGQPDTGRNQGALFNTVGESFFSTMRIPILNGRSFEPRDTATSPPVAIINRALAQRDFTGRNPVGLTFRTEDPEGAYQIVGVCADAKYGWIRDAPPATFYLLYTQQKEMHRGMTFEVRTKGDPRSFIGAIRGAIDSVDRDLPMIDIRTQEEQIDSDLAPERSFAAVTSGFGILALVLASIGVYGVMASAVASRVNEIGVRMALGAQAHQVLWMVLREASWMAIMGIGAGLGAALLLTRFLNSMLFGLKPSDPFTLASAGLMLFTVAMLAGWIPARRAASIQPVQALRHE
ncbi:MAG: ABC transporter permease [Terracidiphilus sp.]